MRSPLFLTCFDSKTERRHKKSLEIEKTVLYVYNGWVKPLTWETWKRTWAKLFAPKPRKPKALAPNREAAYRSEIFETMQPKRPAKKARKCGFERTYNANTSMNLLSTHYRECVWSASNVRE